MGKFEDLFEDKDSFVVISTEDEEVSFRCQVFDFCAAAVSRISFYRAEKIKTGKDFALVNQFDCLLGLVRDDLFLVTAHDIYGPAKSYFEKFIV